MRFCSTGADQFVTNPPRKRQIGKGPMQVSQFAAAEPEFNAAEAMVVGRHPPPNSQRPDAPLRLL